MHVEMLIVKSLPQLHMIHLFDYALEQEEFYGREVILADRDLVEQQSDEIMEGAASEDVAFLVVGDPFG